MDKYYKKIRSSKTISEKYEIIMHYEKLVNENKVQYPKAETVKHFKLKQTSSLNTILAKSSEIKKSFIENQSSETRMRFKNSKYSDIDEELYAYFLKMREKKAQINTNDLKSKALEIGIGNGYDRFNASNGFIRCFKSRYNIHFTELYGDAGGENPAVSSNWFMKISTLIENYEDNNIYNIDETKLSKFLLMNGTDANTVYDFKSIVYDAIDSCKKQSLITDYLIKN